MFDFEAYYKLPNARCEGKYQELKHFLDGFVKDSAARSGREKSFRDRMLAYSRKQAVYLHYLTELEEKYTDEFVRYSSYSTLSEVQKTLFGDFTPEGYVSSTCNPSYTVSVAGKEIGPALAQFASIFREGAMDAISHRRYRLLSKMELYFELHKQLLHGQVRADHLQSLYESFRLNQVNEEMDLRFHKNFDPNASFLTDAVMNADFSDEAYLFEMGQPVTEAALHLNKALAALDQAQLMEAAEKISLRMLCNQPSKRNQQGIKRNLVSLSLPLGAERFAKMLILSLEKNGAEGFISELVPYGLHPKFLRDHRYDIVRGQTDETFQDVKEYVEHITRDNSHLLSGVLGQIQVIFAGAEPVLWTPSKKHPYLPTEDHPRDLPFRNRMRNLNDSIRTAIERINDAQTGSSQQQNSKNFGSRYGFGGYGQVGVSEIYPAFPQLRFLMPDITVIDFSDENQGIDAFKNAFLSLCGSQLSADLVPARAHLVVQDALESGYALYLLGRNGNETDITIGLTDVQEGSTKRVFSLRRNEGSLPGGELLTNPERQGTDGLLHLEKVRIGGRIVNNLKVSFTDGEIVDVSYEGSSELDKNPVQEQLKDAGVSLIGLGLNVSLLENLSKMDGYVPEVIRRKSALSLELGEDVVGLIEYSKIGRLSSVKYNGQLSDVIREGLFMPIGSDVMNIPLMKLYQQEALDAPAEKDVVETAEDIPANEAAEEHASEDAAGTEEGLPQEIIE